MSRPQPITLRIVRCMLAGLRVVVRSLVPTRRLTGRLEYDTAAPGLPSAPELVIGIIDDPELAMRLLSVRGEVSRTSIESLAKPLREIPPYAMLHLDMTDARFTDALIMGTVGEL